MALAALGVVYGDIGTSPLYAVKVKTAGQVKNKYDYYDVVGELSPEQMYRPLAEGGCDFVKK